MRTAKFQKAFNISSSYLQKLGTKIGVEERNIEMGKIFFLSHLL